jgi:hypothetical protein
MEGARKSMEGQMSCAPGMGSALRLLSWILGFILVFQPLRPDCGLMVA